jgi:hypothetical protein
LADAEALAISKDIHEWGGKLERVVKWLLSWVNWLETHSRWSELRALGQSPLVRASVLMPAFGYILLLNENVHQYLTIKYDGWLLQYLPSLWRVWLLFYGTFALAIGSIIFSGLCPAEIKEYVSAFGMADAVRHHLAHQHQKDEARRELQARYLGMSSWERSLMPPISFTHPTLGVSTTDLESTIAIFRWNLENIKHPWTRIFTFLLFWAGLILLAMPATITFLQVTFVLLRHV